MNSVNKAIVEWISALNSWNITYNGRYLGSEPTLAKCKAVVDRHEKRINAITEYCKTECTNGCNHLPR